ncbi:MAG: hypothetical protein KAR84_03205 [Elusimicrobiales bacterium]|nr:hypothetical protein [Elusimicrobiales bacterium]MCK5106112.1 hypothetical protein [Elusimicrobiales bacterium]MCK5584232.1 hypothetical protein [Elusimicrobiales bacterium]
MKNAILAIILTGTMCSMAHAGSALDALKKTAGPVLVEEAVNLTSGPISVEKAVNLPMPANHKKPNTDFVKVSLEQNEISALIGIFNRVNVKATRENSDYSDTKVTIGSRSRGLNPAKWTIMFGDEEVSLTKEEIFSMISMFNRMKVAGSAISCCGVRVTEVIIENRVYNNNLRPAVWTGSYYKKS